MMMIKGMILVFVLISCVYGYNYRDNKRITEAINNKKKFHVISDAVNALTDQMRETNNKLDKMIEIQSKSSMHYDDLNLGITELLKSFSVITETINRSYLLDSCMKKYPQLFGIGWQCDKFVK